MQKQLTLGTTCLGIFATIIIISPCAHAGKSAYEKEIDKVDTVYLSRPYINRKNDTVTYPDGARSSANFGKQIDTLFGQISKNGNAMEAVKNQLLNILCENSQGTVDWQPLKIAVQCNKLKNNLHSRYKNTSLDTFLEIHCAGFCTLNGNGFKEYKHNNNDYDKNQCICNKGNAKTLSVSNSSTAGATPTPTPAMVSDVPANPNTVKELEQTINATDPTQQAASDQPLKAFWNDMAELDKAFKNRVRELAKKVEAK